MVQFLGLRRLLVTKDLINIYDVFNVQRNAATSHHQLAISLQTLRHLLIDIFDGEETVGASLIPYFFKLL